jgi:hypothetical protein
MGQPVGDQVDRRIEGDRLLEHHARPAVEVREEPVDEQDRVGRPGVAG